MRCPGGRFVRSLLAAATALSLGAAPTPEAEIEIDVPLIAENPSAIPVTVTVDHPMEPDHYIERIELALATDPVPQKGTFLFTPLSGRASVSFQMRSGRGGELVASARCSRHGRFEARQRVEVQPGGCSGIAPAEVAGSPSVWTHGGPAAAGIIPVWAKIRHSSHAGLVEQGGQLVRQGEPFFVERLAVFLGEARVSEFRLTAAVSADPQLRFFLRAGPGGTVRVVFENNRGERWEAERVL